MPNVITADLWVVIDLDDEDAPPMAAFPSEKEARAWVALTRSDEGCIDIEVCLATVTVELPSPTDPPPVAP